MLSRNLSLIATILVIVASSIELGASSQNQNEKNLTVRKLIDSKSNAFKTFLGASTIGLKAGMFIVPVAVSKYRLGKKLSKPTCTLTPQSIKNRGLLGIAVGVSAMLPFGIITASVLSEVKQKERANEIFERTKTSEEVSPPVSE